MQHPFLSVPCLKYQTSFLQYVRSYERAGGHYFDMYKKALEDFPAYLAKLRDTSQGKALAQDEVSASTYWLVSQDEVVGVVRVRHRELETAGHIGYDISPKHRNKGYGSLILKLALPKAKEVGLTKAVVTCATNNTASRKIIEKNGGILTGTVFDEEDNENLYKFSIAL